VSCIHFPEATAMTPAAICIEALKAGKKILICGNGGSASMASHFAAEVVVRFARNRRALPCISLTADQAVLTACANDFGYEEVFVRQVEALGASGDILVALSTSGKSRNVNRAIARAHDLGMVVLEPERPQFFTTAEIQQMHLQWLHELAGEIEQAFVE
jgi:D-sedoheptulose 7-phosphate isomerase